MNYKHTHMHVINSSDTSFVGFIYLNMRFLVNHYSFTYIEFPCAHLHIYNFILCYKQTLISVIIMI